ncbi:MAG: glycosyltransferase [Candidatus Syntrophosphaera sp.]
MKKIKIVRIITRLSISGSSQHVMEMAAMFNSGRYSTTVVYGNVESYEQDNLYLANDLGLNMINLPRMKREISPVNDILTIWKLWRIMRKIKPDIVHTHTAKAGQVGRLAAWLAGVPIIIHTFHGNNFKGYFGRFFSGVSVNLERLMARLSTCIIAISERQRRELLAFRIAPVGKIRVIPRGIDLGRIKYGSGDAGKFKQEQGIHRDKKLIGFIGRLTQIKNPYCFINVAARVLKERRDAVFIFAGDGEMTEELRSRVNSLGLRENVIFTGFIKDLRPLYADLDALLLTSFNEGTPVAILESMANSVPVIASRVGGVPDLIEDGVSGSLFDPEDAGGFAKCVLDLLEDPAKYQKMAEAVAETINRDYTLARLRENMEALIQELAGR